MGESLVERADLRHLPRHPRRGVREGLLRSRQSRRLVDRLVDRPGMTSLHHLDGRRTVHERPDFFDRTGRCPSARSSSRRISPATHATSRVPRAERVRDGVARAELGDEAPPREGDTRSWPEGRACRLSAFDTPKTSERIRPADRVRKFASGAPRARRHVASPTVSWRKRVVAEQLLHPGPLHGCRPVERGELDQAMRGGGAGSTEVTGGTSRARRRACGHREQRGEDRVHRSVVASKRRASSSDRPPGDEARAHSCCCESAADRH